VPLVAAPVLLKQQSAHALEAAGVVMDGSSFGSGSARASGVDHDSGNRGSHRVRRPLAMALVAAVVLVATIVALASRPDDGTVDDLAIEGQAIEPASSTTTSAPVETSTTGPVTDVTVEPAPVVSDAPPPTDGPATPDSAPPPALLVAFTLDPTEALPSYVSDAGSGPRLTWEVSGAARVRIEGPREYQPALLSEQMSGTHPVCPGFVFADSCSAQPGSYQYVLYVYDGAGAEVVRRTVTLTVGF
jgi:hypothetical protein